MTVSTTKMTARQFLMLGEDPPGVRLELVNGEIAVSPSPRPRHSYPDRKLTAILVTYVEKHQRGMVIGDTDTIFGEYDVRRPDLIYFSKQRQHLIQGDEAIEGPPDLCVEILGPSSTAIDRKEKFKQYAKGGVAYYWIIDPQEKNIEGYRLAGKRYLLTGRGAGNDIVRLPPFPDLDIPLAELWFPDRGASNEVVRRV